MSKTEKPKTPAKSWRDVMPMHPACAMFPPMSPGELAALAEDIQARGHDGADRVVDANARRTSSKNASRRNTQLLDGRNRLDAMEWSASSRSMPAARSWLSQLGVGRSSLRRRRAAEKCDDGQYQPSSGPIPTSTCCRPTCTAGT